MDRHWIKGGKTMICPRCGFEQPDDSSECFKCGVIFEKYKKRRGEQAATPESDGAIHPGESKPEAELNPAAGANQDAQAAAVPAPSTGEALKNLFLFVNVPVNPISFGLRTLLFLILLIWGTRFIISPLDTKIMNSFWHLVNLPFHEAGHIFFSPLGKFLTMLGGSLLQLIVPVVCLAALLYWTRDTFGAAVCLWWLGQSFMDLAPYIGDARALRLPLLGGFTGREVADYHDWEYLLGQLGWLQYDRALAWAAHLCGSTLMILTFLWAGYLLSVQLKNLDY